MMFYNMQRNECIIGGIRKGKEMKGAMTLSPKEAYFNCTSKRLWLFESNDPSGITLVAPFGLYANISIFFPHFFY